MKKGKKEYLLIASIFYAIYVCYQDNEMMLNPLLRKAAYSQQLQRKY